MRIARLDSRPLPRARWRAEKHGLALDVTSLLGISAGFCLLVLASLDAQSALLALVAFLVLLPSMLLGMR